MKFYYADAGHMTNMSAMHINMSRVVRKPAFCICENKDEDRLHSSCKDDQHLCFPTWIYIEQFLCFLNLKFQSSSHQLRLHLANPEDRFSCIAAHMVITP